MPNSPDSSTIESDDETPIDGSRRHWRLPLGVQAGFALAVVLVVITAALAYRSLDSNVASVVKANRTNATIDQLQQLLSNLKDAETGERGFLVTGLERYLEPYNAAIAAYPSTLDALRTLAAGNATLLGNIQTLQAQGDEKLDLLKRGIALRRDGLVNTDATLQLSDQDKAVMDRIRLLVARLQREERARLADQQDELAGSIRQTFVVTLGGATILVALIALAAWLMARAHRETQMEVWLRAGQAGFAARLLGEKRIDAIGRRGLSFLSRYIGAPLANLYVVEDRTHLRHVAGYAQKGTASKGAPTLIGFGEGLVGQVARDNEPVVVRDLPAGYLEVGSSLGRGAPRELLIAPAGSDGELQAVIELGFLRSVDRIDRELLARVAQQVAVAVRTARERERVETLLEQTQQQAAELQAQQEELRVSNEELEEQGRALKTSQVQLENQQAELEQTNSQLEEQTQVLGRQKDSLERAQEVLNEKAIELERSNNYKSEFLANMSHELRTPLNSTLILAKLLADNKDQNLSPEQVKFAETIGAAGNDLLVLINDILDLSKIEAGKVDVEATEVTLARVTEALDKTFEPMAGTKSLTFSSTIDAATPATIRTDEQRLAQILRNLISNAIKFTETGAVTLTVGAPDAQTVSFAVKDSGIGIAPHEQDVIFEAFRQADGSTHRRFGGTGLGLSISRNLARLLGGDIAIESAPGQGSTFTLTLPRAYVAPPPAMPERRQAVERRQAPAPVPMLKTRTTPRPAPVARPAPAPLPSEGATNDDRDHLDGDSRVILVIEDDLRFAGILKDMVREMGYQCVVCHTAGEGLQAAAAYLPSAILLDMNLPDFSGLAVLDQLKRNPKTRHIPVHVASVADYSKEARELGAVGYDMKPVAREQLLDAMEGLRSRFVQQLRRVLIVEDDPRQLESLSLLLGNDRVEIVGATSAEDALERLRESTFDCVVMDLNLPDLSGYELLEQMSSEEEVSFPPVIVYTGRVLTRDEEQRLARYSKSIIIKDARSPERLLDEVTLFLHQVESELPPERQRMLREARSREAALEGRNILIVEDDVRNVFALTSVLEPKGVKVGIARNGKEALEALDRSRDGTGTPVDLVLMDIMMPEMDGYTAMREIRKNPAFKRLPIIALTAKAMRDDQEKCIAAGANDYMAKPLDVEKLLSLVRVWMPK